MKTEKELNKDILEITMKITKEFPELVKYMGEIPVKISNESGVEAHIKNLENYYESLKMILKKYTPSHIRKK